MKLSKKNLLDFFLVIIIFGCTGLTTVYLSAIIMGALGFEPWSLGYILGYIFLIFPVYHLLLLIYAAIFGRFDFFVSRQKKIIAKLISFFKKERSDQL